MFLVVTGVLINFLRGREQAVSFVNLESDRIILSSIVVVELQESDAQAGNR